jgi:O-acetyl-ADP-ribose deacetylase (regulator of RNase III)
VKIRLCGRSAALVEAWRKDFAGATDVEITRGDILDLSADAIVSPANSFGFMDGGLDLIYSRRFGWGVQAQLQDLLQAEHDGELPVGQAVIVPTGDPAMPLLISAPTMRVPMDVSRTVNAYLAFRAVIRVARQYNTSAATPIGSILCPGLATGAGRLSPEACSRQMQYAYSASHLRRPSKPVDLGAAVDIHYRMLGLK